MNLEGLEAAIDLAIEADFEAERILKEEIVPRFERLDPEVRLRLAFKIAYRYDRRYREFVDPKSKNDPSETTSTTSISSQRSRKKYWEASDGSRFGYTVERELDDKGRERFASFFLSKTGERTKVVHHAKKKDAILRAARLLVEHEAKAAPHHAKDAFATAVAIAKKAERPDEMWESLNEALKAAKKAK